MLRIYLRIILDILFPPTPHERLLRTLSPEQFIHHYQPTQFRNVIALAPYTNRTVQAAVAACKFEKNQHAAMLLAALCDQWLTLHPKSGITILVPIPLSTNRQKERGFNQVTRVLEHLSPATSIHIANHILARQRDTQRQTSLDKNARQKNMNDAFIVTSHIKSIAWTPVSRLIICDDVLTTGATVLAARAALAPHVPTHVEIQCIAWAH